MAAESQKSLVVLAVQHGSWTDCSMGVLMQLPETEAALHATLAECMGKGRVLGDVIGLYTFDAAYSLEELSDEAHAPPEVRVDA
eukprot:1549829-Prymnesium_polylepis.1